jgi:phosphoenolpyruvate synthase/pyruvate phosphate dikinase
MNKIGAKTLKLSDLKSLGLNVPKFKAIDSPTLQKNLKDFDPLAKKLHEELACKKYAVRSSALIEDSQEESFAGQFRTEIAVTPKKLAEAIDKVTEHAKEFLKGDLDKFSILVQEYIEPDISGVTFTRNPTSGREMIIEHHKGRGEDLVSGNIKPEKTQVYWPTSSPKTSLPKSTEAIENFKKIEEFYKFPQDIEWCIKNKKWYFLQTRPITTISKTEYEQSIYLDKHLPRSNFYYEKTEISEIAQRPTQITQDLLEKAYEENGPIQKVYEKHKIKYSPKDILKIVGNELFIDREEELKTLLPAYSYLDSKDLKPKLSSFSGIFQSLKNVFFLYKIKLDHHKELFKKLKTSIESSKEPTSIEEFLKIFMKDYQIVFEINLLAGISIKKIANLIAREKDISLSLLLSHGHQLLSNQPSLKVELKTNNLKGNTLEVSDKSQFTRNLSNEKENKEIQKWWDKLSEIKKTMLKGKIEQAVTYNKLREISRWLVVKRTNQLRNILQKESYFAKLEEITQNKISQSTIAKRKEEYKKYDKFNMPTILTNKIITRKQQIQGVSPGKAEGTVVTEDEINNSTNKDKILFTKVLSPDLTKYFDEIKGIISEQGGFLSHLSIIARERGLPVITGVSENQIKKGEKMFIDGSTGKIIQN